MTKRPVLALLHLRVCARSRPVSYGTGKTPPGQGHTGARVPVAAIGPQASNVMGIRDQTDLFYTLIGRKSGW